MKIIECEAIPLIASFDKILKNDAWKPFWERPSAHFQKLPRKNQTSILVRIKTDKNQIGFGESWGLLSLDKTLQKFNEIFELGILNKDFESSEDLISFCQKEASTDNFNSSHYLEALSGIELALQDAEKCGMVKTNSNLPINVYASPIPFAPINMQIQLISEKFEQGFNKIKIKLGVGVSEDQETCRIIRQHFPNIDFIVDINGGYNLSQSLKMAYFLKDHGFLWLEEPLHKDNLDQYIELTAKSPIPIALGENSHTLQEFTDLINLKACHMITPNICRVGGMSGMQKIYNLCKSKQMAFSMHGVGGAIALKSSIEFLIRNNADNLLEINFLPNPLRDDLIKIDFKIENGLLFMKTIKPNEIQMDVLKKYRIEEKINAY